MARDQLIQMDPPGHTELRNLMNSPFKPHAIRETLGAVVGHPSRDYLWILARTRTMDPADYETLLARIEAQGYDLARLNQTPQPSAP